MKGTRSCFHSCIRYLEAAAQSWPQAVAVADGTRTYSFSELRQTALRVAAHIQRQAASVKSQPIGVLLPKSADAIAVFMGILYSGNIYVPLDVKMPAARLEKIMKELEPLLTISSDDLGSFLNADPEGFSYASVLEKVIDLDPAYILFTSGSTGTPKGVVISHRGITDYIEWASACYEVDSSTVIGNQSPFYFDNSTLDLYLSLRNGARLEIIPEYLFGFPGKLIEFVAEKRITQIFWVPSVLMAVANAQALENRKTSLEKVLFAGEVMPNKQLNYWRRHLPQALFSNLYGPTEITVDCTYYVVDRVFEDHEPLPIGYGRNNAQVLVIHTEGRLCSEGEQGELCVRGSLLGQGYWRDPEKTARAFTQNPLHNDFVDPVYRTGDIVYTNQAGELIFVGRRDSQIKHMGYRIDLGEIEAAAQSLSVISHCCALYSSEESAICLFYVRSDSAPVTEADLKLALLKLLPKYMVPTRYREVEALPQTSNGKIDRLKLQETLSEGMTL